MSFTTWFGARRVWHDPGVLQSPLALVAFHCTSVSCFTSAKALYCIIYVCVLHVIATFIMKVLVHYMLV